MARVKKLEALAQRLEGYSEQTLIISSEALCFLRTTREYELLFRFIERIGRDVQTLLVFRNNQDWRESWRNQLTKKHSSIFEAVSAEEKNVSILGEWYFNKAAIRDFWKPFNLLEFDYDEHQNIVDALYNGMGISTDTLETNIFVNRQK